MMRLEETPQEKSQDQVHCVRITLSSKNLKNLKKVCAELDHGVKDKRLTVKEDEVVPEAITPIASKPLFEGGTTEPHTPKLQSQRPSKKGCTNFRWSPAMTRFLLPFLIQQANFGKKTGRSFRREAFIAAAEAVTQKFRLQCNDGNVENHLRTIKTRYQQIKRLQNLNNTTWDEKEKKIVMSDKDYGRYISANQRDELFLNKPIELYDEIVRICGDYSVHEGIAIEHAKEKNEEVLVPKEENEDGFVLKDNEDDSIPKEENGDEFIPKEDNQVGFITTDGNADGHESTALGDDVNITVNSENVEVEELGEPTAPIPPPPSSGSPLVFSSSDSSERTQQCVKKRKSHHLQDKIHYLASQIGELAAAIRSSRRDIAAELYEEVMKCEGYDEECLGKAFDHLNENENLARGFLVKSRTLRQAWLSEFFPAANGSMI